MPLKMNGRVPPEMTGRSNLGTATYISWNVPPEMGDKCQYHLIWVAALPTVQVSYNILRTTSYGSTVPERLACDFGVSLLATTFKVGGRIPRKRDEHHWSSS